MRIIKIETWILLFAGLFLAQNVSCSAQHGDSIYVATWNLENLFDTIDDPEKRDEDFLPDGRKNWTNNRLDIKINNLTKIFEYMNDGKGPDILGVQEVEHKRLLNRLLGNLSINKNYSIAYIESPDKRGIDNGLIYNSNIFRLVKYRAKKVLLPSNYPTRDILEVELSYLDTETVIVYVNHWPSRSGGQEKSEPNRIAAAKTIKSMIDSVFQINKDANIIVLGDLNDEPSNISVFETLSAKYFSCDSSESATGRLFNITSKLYETGLGTYLYKGDWNMLDHIILSESLVLNDTFSYVCNSIEIIKPDFMITKEGNYKGAAMPTYGGKKYFGGFSDHYPVGAKILHIQN